MIAFIVIGLAGLLGATIGPVVSVGMAYKAKTLCSELFVSGRPQSDILIDLAVDDLRPLRLVRAKVDTGQRDVVARFLLAKRKARFTDGFGCTLAPWPYTGADGPQALASGGPWGAKQSITTVRQRRLQGGMMLSSKSWMRHSTRSKAVCRSEREP
jgi:hypothetical protein